MGAEAVWEVDDGDDTFEIYLALGTCSSLNYKNKLHINVIGNHIDHQFLNMNIPMLDPVHYVPSLLEIISVLEHQLLEIPNL